MAKKTKVTIEETTSSLPVEDLTTYTEVIKTKDPLAEKVIALKNKGFDNNRIAATLMVNRHTIDSILNDPTN